MTATRAIENFNDSTQIRWMPMLVVSASFHFIVFFMILFIPQGISSRGPNPGTVYEVNLVEMPATGKPGDHRADKEIEEKTKAVSSVKNEAKTKRIESTKPDKKPLIIAKRTIKSKTKKPEISASQLIDRAISRVKKRVKSENSDHLDKAISQLAKNTKESYGGRTSGGGALDGLPIRIYQMEVENRIKSNWSYPVAVRDQKKLEAIVVLTVKEDGSIVKITFKKRSGDSIFDQSAEKAVEKSNPLPPFPEGLRESYEELEINFNLKDLEEYS